MALTGTFTVRVQKPGAMLAEAMSEMRVWLDHHHIELVDFGITETSVSGTAFNLCFRREAEASLCSVAFASPHPMIVWPPIFDNARVSQSTMTRTMSVNEPVKPAAIAGVTSGSDYESDPLPSERAFLTLKLVGLFIQFCNLSL